jgi:hypothetical protein
MSRDDRVQVLKKSSRQSNTNCLFDPFLRLDHLRRLDNRYLALPGCLYHLLDLVDRVLPPPLPVSPSPPPGRPPPRPNAPRPVRVVEPAPARLTAVFGFADMDEAYVALATLPCTYKPLPPAVGKAFSEAAGKVADRFNAEPSDRALFDFLCLPKIGLAPGQPTDSTKRLAKYPNVVAPEKAARTDIGFRSSPSAAKQVELGRLGNAARILGENTGSFAAATPELLETLKSKHPTGSRVPFGNSTGPLAHTAPSTEAILESFRSFKHDTAPGLSGWTVPLLRVALRSDSVQKMLTTLVTMLLAGNAPGRKYLCSSRLIALEKPDGGVRPIAIGELVYRLCTKAIVRHSFKPDCLSPCQFGVGTRGGVEPIIRAIQRGIDGTIDGEEFTHVVSLDFSNAFNTLDRSGLAKAIKQFAPGLYRLARWVYNGPSNLIFGGIQEEPQVISSSQGVRQGDPLGPLLFSVGIRPILDKLAGYLGVDCVILAYLDDIYILSKGPDALDLVTEFFNENDYSLKLNANKSFITSIEEIKTTGLKVLGSCLGPKHVRAEFLQEKVALVEQKINRLVDLPHQHALLLLRQCLQQDLRHLQRCLVSDDLVGVWNRLDQALWDGALRIRGARDQVGVDGSRIDHDLLSLPVRHGGLGLLSHKTCAPLAFAAACDTSDHLLVALLGEPEKLALLIDANNADTIAPQRTRCNEALNKQRDALFSTLDDTKTKTIIESSSGLGKKWLSVVPFYQSLRLSDFEVSSALHVRTLHTGSGAVCSGCGCLNFAGHAEVCTERTRWNIARHEQVKRAIATALCKIEGVQVAVEPHIGNTNRRNDIRVTGSEASGMSSHEYDVTVVSLATRDSIATILPPGLHPTKSADRAHALVNKFLTFTSDKKRQRLPSNNIPFTPLVFSLGGMMDPGTIKALQTWQETVPPSVFASLCQQLSLILLRARAKSFVL